MPFVRYFSEPKFSISMTFVRNLEGVFTSCWRPYLPHLSHLSVWFSEVHLIRKCKHKYKYKYKYNYICEYREKDIYKYKFATFSCPTFQSDLVSWSIWPGNTNENTNANTNTSIYINTNTRTFINTYLSHVLSHFLVWFSEVVHLIRRRAAAAGRGWNILPICAETLFHFWHTILPGLFVVSTFTQTFLVLAHGNLFHFFTHEFTHVFLDLGYHSRQFCIFCWRICAFRIRQTANHSHFIFVGIFLV